MAGPDQFFQRLGGLFGRRAPARAVHTFDNGVRLYDEDLLEAQRERYQTTNLHEPEEEAWFIDMLTREAGGRPVTIADIGAAVGYYSILAKRTVPNAKVFAFEPLPPHMQALKDNLALNGVADGVTLIDEAVSDHLGTAGFLEHHYGSKVVTSEESTATTSVATTTLEQVVNERSGPLLLVKVDVQGHELAVIDGAAPVCRSIHRWIIGTHGKDIHDGCVSRLVSLGYTILCDDPAPQGQPDGLVVATL